MRIKSSTLEFLGTVSIILVLALPLFNQLVVEQPLILFGNESGFATLNRSKQKTDRLIIGGFAGYMGQAFLVVKLVNADYRAALWAKVRSSKYLTKKETWELRRL
jgi:hypothetical protein